MTKLGFTGTRKGMSKCQQAIIIDILREEGITEFHHGDCVGADKQFHDIVVKHNRFPYNDVSYLHVHPPDVDTYRAFCKEGTIHSPKPYLERNKDIVDSSDLIIACPHVSDEINKQRSGTWSTIRYAKSKEKDIIILCFR